MCGRYATTVDPETLQDVFDAEQDTRAPAGHGIYGGDAPRPRYNIAPTDPVAIVRQRPDREDEPGARVLSAARWGLVPSWAKDVSVGSRMINARAETVPDKAAFKTAFQRRRALVPASGYYEWQVIGEDAKGKPRKQPYYITPADGSVLAFAGLWEFWRSPEGDPVVSTSVITTESVGELQQIHDRMPLILPASDWELWLDPEQDGDAVLPLLAPIAVDLAAELELRPVGPAVGNVRNDDPSLIAPIDPLT